MSMAALSKLRESLAGCEVALLVDLPTGTCLLSSQAIQHDQDRLEKLCAETALFLGLEGTSDPALCVVSGPLEITAFARLASDQPEALSLVFAPTAELNNLGSRVFSFLSLQAFGGEVV